VNLFHSFGNFNVPTNNIANFLNDSGLATSNILGRVTGGNPSSIFGMIQTTGFGNANLFLMNPAGFLFGPNATLNVGGMAAFTTANYLRLADGVRFNAFPDAATDALLSPAPVAAFGFIGPNPAAIAIQGSTLQVVQGKNLSLVGGNQGFTATDPDTGNPINVPGGITMTGGKLSAPLGQINMVSVAGPGEISTIDYLPSPGMTMGNINLSQGAILDVSGDSAGTVRIRGGELVMDTAMISADTINANGAPVAIDIDIPGNVSISNTDIPALTARTTGAGNAGEIKITSGSMDVTSTLNQGFFFSAIDTHTSGSGNAGNVNISTGTLTVTGDPSGASIFIDSGTSGPAPGRGGDVSIKAGTIGFEAATISTGNFVASFLDGSGVGTAGNVNITADHLQMKNGSAIITDQTDFVNPAGRSGNINIAARDFNLSFSGLSTSGSQQSGSIVITGDQLIANESNVQSITTAKAGGGISIKEKVIEFSGGSTIASSTGGNGDAGPITITATDHLAFLNSNTQGGRPSGIFNTNSIGQSGTIGNAGDVVITTPSLQLTGGSRIDTTTATSGRGGNITIFADSIVINGEIANVPTEGLFNLGSTQGSGIYTRTIGGSCAGPCGNAGNISINTGSFSMGAGSQINSGTSSSGRGGTISITATDTIGLSGTLSTGQPGGIQTRSTALDADAGAGGNISLTAGESVTISNGASVSASTTGPGNAGNILVKANDVAISGGGTITAASTGAGNAGTVTIQGTNSPANSFLVDGAGSGVFTTTSNTGTGGNITIDANAVTLQNGATVSSSSTGTGNTGNIQITAENQFAMTNSSVTTEANQSSGGVIKITTSPGGNVQLNDSTISASVLDGAGGGGSVNIDPQAVVLQNGQILANAVFGPGGNIFITTNLLLADPASRISASSQFGQQGTITIQSPISPASGKLNPISSKPLIATSLVNQRCAVLAGGSISSFTVAGRDTLPAEPSGWLSSPLALSTLTTRNGPEADGDSATPLLSLRQIAPPGFLTQIFAVASDCQS
jgi:filamentous hemagglutinin family protein